MRGLSAAEMQAGAKRLNTVDSPGPSDSKGSKADVSERSALEALEDLYERYDGDLDKIFLQLKADPTKAKKPHHRPRDAREFAAKYLEGYYSLVDDAVATAADAKASHK